MGVMMRRIIAVLFTILIASSLSAASYNDNKWQRMADECIQQAESAKRAGLYDKAVDYAQKASEYAELSKKFILEADIAPALFPEFYITGTWAHDRDCLWNIAGRSFIYNNPWKWRYLYNDNKSFLPQPRNPDLIKPGLKLHIPSIKGEERSGVYDPEKEYGTFE